MQQSKVSVKYSEENSVFGRVSLLSLIGVFVGGCGVGRVLIRGRALIRVGILISRTGLSELLTWTGRI